MAPVTRWPSVLTRPEVKASFTLLLLVWRWLRLRGTGGNDAVLVMNRLAEIDEQLNTCASEMASMTDSPLWQLKAMVDDAAYAEIPGELDIDFNEAILPNGDRVTLQASVATENGVLRGDDVKGRILKTVGKAALGAGLGAALGTAIGPLSGGEVGRGAIYGTAIGAGVGALASAADRGDEVVLQTGDQLILRLDQAVVVEAPQQ